MSKRSCISSEGALKARFCEWCVLNGRYRFHPQTTLFQRESHRYISASQGFLPTGQIVNMPQSCVAPGIGAVKNNNLVPVV